jgi:ATP-dependent DNA helicase RecG
MIGSGGVNMVKFIKKDYVPEQANGGLNGGLNKGLKSLLIEIEKNPGVQIRILTEKLHRPVDTCDKQIRILTKMKLVERRESKKTGGYWVVEPGGDRL